MRMIKRYTLVSLYQVRVLTKKRVLSDECDAPERNKRETEGDENTQIHTHIYIHTYIHRWKNIE
jgi:hypothetical protein